METLRKTVLGKTGLSVSRLGFGGIPIQKIGKEETRKLFDVLEAEGINYIDTARAYTVSEEQIGYALEGRREKFVLATKSMAKTAEDMARDIDKSLQNLRTDYIDLYQIHNPAPDALSGILGEGGALDALFAAKKAGKIGHIGLTTHFASVFRAALAYDWVETLMFPYNIVENGEEELIAACREKNIAFIAMKPLAGGAIEDAEAAMRFVFANPDVTVVIPGAAEEKEILQNKKAALRDDALTEDEIAKFSAIRDTLGTQFCRRCNYCQPCTRGIKISNIFLFEGYYDRYGLQNWAKERYRSVVTEGSRASDCIGCGVCETRCPYHLPIREMLKRAAKKFDV